MLEVCCTHIAISDNLKAMGLKEQKTVNAIWRQNKPYQKGPKNKGPKHHNRGGKQRKVNVVGTDEDAHCDEVGVVAVIL